MTAPRQVRPGVTYLITRRCFARVFLLRPSPLVNAVFEYVPATKAREYGIVLHAYRVRSNHWNCVLTDPLGRLPEFQRDRFPVPRTSRPTPQDTWLDALMTRH